MPTRRRLYDVLIDRRQARTRSQVETWVNLGKVFINGVAANSPNAIISEQAELVIQGESYVSRAAYKLASVAGDLKLDFQDKIILDVGSSTGGFSDYALKHGAKKVVAVDVGTNQMHDSLRTDPRVELHEQTDIRDFVKYPRNDNFDLILVDVSFISLRDVLPVVARICDHDTQVAAMLKPQFEAGSRLKNKGVIKNDTKRREILRQFESWAKELFVIVAKADSEVSGTKGNKERFYLLQKSL